MQDHLDEIAHVGSDNRQLRTKRGVSVARLPTPMSSRSLNENVCMSHNNTFAT